MASITQLSAAQISVLMGKLLDTASAETNPLSRLSMDLPSVDDDGNSIISVIDLDTGHRLVLQVI